MARPRKEIRTLDEFEAELRRLGIAEDKVQWLMDRRRPINDFETTAHSLLLIGPNRCSPYLYIVQCEGSQFYKVGVSTVTPINRLAGLQVGCPFTLRMPYVFADPSAHRLEREIHIHLKHCHVRGEWFELKPLEVQALIREIANKIGAGEPIMRRVAA